LFQEGCINRRLQGKATRTKAKRTSKQLEGELPKRRRQSRIRRTADEKTAGISSAKFEEKRGGSWDVMEGRSAAGGTTWSKIVRKKGNGESSSKPRNPFNTGPQGRKYTAKRRLKKKKGGDLKPYMFNSPVTL